MVSYQDMHIGYKIVSTSLKTTERKLIIANPYVDSYKKPKKVTWNEARHL